MSGSQGRVSCLFVHGWAMNHTVWQPVIDKLPDWVDACVMDLPGHGSRHKEGFNNLHELTEDLRVYCRECKKNSQPLLLVGWSLGALPCLQLAAEHMESVDGLMLVSSNPSFITRENWSSGISVDVFEQFAQALKSDFSGTIRRFLALQVKGSDSGRLILRSLREHILQQPEPDANSLDAGLAILKQADLRHLLKQIKQPVCWVLGEQDGLVKVELAEALNCLMNQAEVKRYPKAGHAPFLSHTEEFTRQLTEFASALVSRKKAG